MSEQTERARPLPMTQAIDPTIAIKVARFQKDSALARPLPPWTPQCQATIAPSLRDILRQTLAKLNVPHCSIGFQPVGVQRSTFGARRSTFGFDAHRGVSSFIDSWR